MAQIRIKRSTGSTAPSSSDLANAELAFTEGNDILYYGEGTSGSNAASVLKIGGSGAFVDLTNAQTVAGNKTFSNNVVVTGNLTVNGTTTTVATTNTTVSDNLLELNSGAGSNANDCGLLIERGSTGDNAFIGWDESTDKFLLGTTTATADSTGNLTVSTGTLVGNLEGNVTGNVTGNTSGSAGSCTGNSATSTALANGRTIGMTGDVVWTSASFDGTGNVTGTATIQADAVDMAMLNVSGTASSSTYLRGDGAWASLSGTDTTYSISCVDGDNSDEEKIRLTAGGDGSGTDDVVLEAGTGLSVARSGDKITFTNTVSDTNTTYSVGDGGLTQNNFTNALKSKLDAIEDSATADQTDEEIQDVVGAMFTSNTETGITATYQDADGTIDLVVGTLNQDTTGTAAIATTVTVADESSDTTCFPLFSTAATGDLGPKSGSNLTFNSSTGQLDFTVLDGGTW